MRGIHRSPVNSPHKGQWRGALVFSLICVWINGWVNNGEAGDLRRYRAHYDVTVMNILINTNRLNVDKVFPKRHQLCLFLCLPNTLFQIVSSRRMWYRRTYILTLSRLLQNRTPSPPDTVADPSTWPTYPTTIVPQINSDSTGKSDGQLKNSIFWCILYYKSQGNSFWSMPSGNGPLTELMVIKIHDAILRH